MAYIKAMKPTFPLVLIAAVWFINGFFCKVLNLVPRHEAIVERILGSSTAPILTPLIGLGEMTLAAIILTGWRARQVTILQILLVLTMNLIEFILAPDLLLWGPLNIIWATLFCSCVWISQYYHERVLIYVR